LASAARAETFSTQASHFWQAQRSPFPAYGADNARVTLDLYFGFVHPPSMSALNQAMRAVERHPDVRVVFHLADISNDLGAEAALEAQRQSRFWPFLQQLSLLRAGYLNLDQYERVARAAELDVNLFHERLSARRHRDLATHLAAIERSRGHFAGDFLCNGVRVGAWTGETGLDQFIKEARHRADVLLDGGASPERVYATLFAEAHGENTAPAAQLHLNALGTHFTRGSKFAPLELIVVSDLVCPSCAELNRVVDRFLSAHPKAVRQLWRPLASDRKFAREAIELAFSAEGENKFWPFYERLSKKTPTSWSEVEAVADACQISAAAEAPTSPVTPIAQVLQYLGQEVVELRRHGVTYVPTLILNGNLFVGVPTFDELEAVAEMELQKGLLERLAPAKSMPR
jgi:protein-disulfide isomerase